MFNTFAVLYIAWGAFRGTQRQFCQELYAVITLAFLFFFSISLFSLTFKTIHHTLSSTYSNFWSFSFSLFFVLMLFFPVRSRLRQFFEQKYGQVVNKKAGMILGMVRVLLVLLLITTIISLIPSPSIQKFIIGDSGVGSYIQLLHHLLKT